MTYTRAPADDQKPEPSRCAGVRHLGSPDAVALCIPLLEDETETWARKIGGDLAIAGSVPRRTASARRGHGRGTIRDAAAVAPRMRPVNVRLARNEARDRGAAPRIMRQPAEHRRCRRSVSRRPAGHPRTAGRGGDGNHRGCSHTPRRRCPSRPASAPLASLSTSADCRFGSPCHHRVRKQTGAAAGQILLAEP
jgi:hypothetical protein